MPGMPECQNAGMPGMPENARMPGAKIHSGNAIQDV